MLRLVLSTYVGSPASKREFQTAPNGKPRLQQAIRRGLSFSLSHSRDLALVAVAPQQPVRIDVEAIRYELKLSTLVGRFVSETKRKLLMHTPFDTRRALFFRASARKEAVLKARGRILTLDPGRVVVLRSASVSNPQSTKVDTDGEQWNVRDVDFLIDYAAAVTVTTRDWELRGFEHLWRSALGSAWGFIDRL